jgi:acyl transferase domain-containing protein/SAM-dependent methyltransferase
MKNPEIAIIGMACRFPGANNYQEFWNNLIQGINSIQEIPPERWDLDEYYSPIIDELNKSISKWCGLLDHIDHFDNRFFSISPREAKQMDPQQRLLLEETWHCVEDSGVSLKTLQAKKTAVYVGVMASDYHQEAVAADVVTDSYAALGNYDCILANRISYTFGFCGASQSIDAACAASMVALHNAKASLLSGDSDYAIAAGVSLNFHPWKYISFSKSRMLSPDGQCKTFDKDANGYVPGEGVGVLLLQPLDDALRARNHIYGIIKGSAVNHGGQALSITAPRVEAQRNVILAAYKDAQISPETVTYVEAHGTGTSLGDPIEVEALTWAFREYTDGRHFCQIGSVKTNIGHLEAAAGIAGVIKVLLMMQHQQIPPTLNIKTINPVINFEHSPFVVATHPQNWQPHCKDLPVLRASVSSFGFGGVNSHALLESFSQENQRVCDSNNKALKPETSNHLFILSAKSEKALKKPFLGWKNFVDSQKYSEYHLTDICATVMTGREHFPYRYGCYVHNKAELKTFLQKDIFSIVKSDTHEWCLYVGELIWENGADVQSLLEQYPLINEHLNKIQHSLSTLDISDDLKEGFKSTAWYPSLKPLYSFMVNYAYLSALMELGLTPNLITGEKTGLWCALTLSGMMKLEDALAILRTQKTLDKIQLVRPQVPFYDPVTHQTRLPYHFDEDYLHFLVDDLSIAIADVHHFVERALLLKDSQFTFKKYLEEWCLILRQHTGIDLDSMLFNDRFIHSPAEKDRKKQVLLMLIIKSALRQLDQKWDLTRTKRIKEQKFQELLDLVIDGVMPKETVVELFVGEEIPNITGIATLLNKRQELLNANKPYQFLNKHSQYLPVNTNLSQWFEKAMVSDSSQPDIQNMSYLVFGEFNQPTTPDSSIQIAITDKPDNVFQETLLKLWLKGLDIKWDILYPEGTFNKIPLPTYCFDRASFWLTKKYQKMLSQPKSETEQHVKTSSAQVLTSRPNEELRDVLDNRENSNVTMSHPLNLNQDDNLVSILPQTTLGKSANSHTMKEQPQSLKGDLKTDSKMTNNIVTQIEREILQQHLNQDLELGIPEVEQYGHLLLLKSFQFMQLFQTEGETYTKSQLKAQIGLMTKYTRLFDGLLDILARSGIIWQKNGEIIVTDKIRQPSLQQRLANLQAEKNRLVQRFPDKLAHLNLLEAGISALKEILASEIKATELLFPNSSLSLVEGFYCGNQFADYYNYLLAKYIRYEIETRLKQNTNQKIRLLEIGAGTGGSSVKVLEQITSFENQVEYCYTDISMAFIKYGKKQLGTTYPFMSFHTLNIEGISDEKYAELGQFDLIFATNVIHATKNLVNTFEAIKRLLKPAGCLLLNELTYVQDFLTLTFGLLDGWWLFEDEKLRLPHSPLLGSLNWKAFYTQMGFGNVNVLGNPLQALKAQKQCLIVGYDMSNQVSLPTNEIPVPRQKNQNISDDQKQYRQNHYQITAKITILVAKALEVETSQIGLDDKFSELGIDSILGVELVNEINQEFHESLSTTTIFDYPSVNELSEYLAKQTTSSINSATSSEADKALSYEKPALLATEHQMIDVSMENQANRLPDASLVKAPIQKQAEQSDNDVAIIGLSGQFPGASNIDEFWANIANGKNAISEIPKDRWNINPYFESELNRSIQTSYPRGGFLADIDKFDPLFFNISPKEAELMDPQQRLFLQESWKAIEDAGYTSQQLSDQNVGIYVGVRESDYFKRILDNQQALDAHVFTGNDTSILAARLAYYLNLKGPSLAINTACSSSLVAIHLACQQIRTQQLNMAIAGGVLVMTTPQLYTMSLNAAMLSPEGQCKTFDNEANGFVLSEGLGIVVLKSLKQAITDGDHIYGVIKGSDINQDGKTNGITAPSTRSQTRLELDVYQQANINPETISYVEAHGTGTKLGDPIEVEALTNAYRQYSHKKQFCAIGSVKTNIGHTQHASGVAGVIKVLLALKHQKMAPSLNFQTPNEHINFKDSPFYVNTELCDWQTKPDVPRRATVSAFGFSGTNAHIVIEEYKQPQPSSSTQGPQVIVLSAKNEERLQAYAQQMVDFLTKPQSITASQPLIPLEEAELCSKIQQNILKLSSHILNVNENDLETDETLSEYGFDEMGFTQLTSQLNECYQLDITATLFTEYSTIEAVGQYVYNHLKENKITYPNQTLSLTDMAYTLQVGRSVMEVRLAMIVSSHEELQEKLTQYIQGQTEIEDFYTGNIKTGQTQFEHFIQGRAGKEFVRVLLEDRELTKVAQLWVSGVNIDWPWLYLNQKPQRISLPSYPFARNRYWLSENKSAQIMSRSKLPTLESNQHPIIQKREIVPSANSRLSPAENSRRLETFQQDLLNLTATILKLDEQQIDFNDKLTQYGFDSISFMTLANKINDTYHFEVAPSLFFEYASIASLSQFLYEEYQDYFNASEQGSLEIATTTMMNAQRKGNEPIVHTLRGGNPPLSFIQLPMWHSVQSKPKQSFYNIPCDLYFNGEINIDLLKQSLHAIIQRHETLRTAFTLIEGQPVQMIMPMSSVNIPFQAIDLSTLSETERNAEVQRLSDEDARRLFKLDQAPLIRFTLLQIEAEKSVLLMNAHHIVFDGSSFNLFLQELAACYTAFATNQMPLLPELPIQYADFAVWQWHQEKSMETPLSYWQEQLGGTLPVLNLPIDRPRHQTQHNGTIYSFQLSNQETTQALINLSGQHKSTLFMTLMAALQAVIYGYTNQTNFCIGTNVANRHDVQVERLIGPFTNYLPICADLSGNPTVPELLNRVRKTVLAAFDNAVVFMKIVETVLHKQDFSLIPPFQVTFLLHNELQDSFKPIQFSEKLVLDHILAMKGDGGAKRDWTFHVIREREELICYLKYDTDLYDKMTITRMVEDLINVVKWMVADEKRHLSDLPFSSELRRR